MKNFRTCIAPLIALVFLVGFADAAKKNVKGVQKQPNNNGAHYYTRTAVGLVSTVDTLMFRADTTTSNTSLNNFTTSSFRTGYPNTPLEANPDSMSLAFTGTANQADSATFTGWASVSIDNGTTFVSLPRSTCVFPGTETVWCIIKAPYIPDALYNWKGYVSTANDSLYFSGTARDYTNRK